MVTEDKRYISVDLLKVICASFVILNHSPFSGEQTHSLLFPFWVYQAVPIFMVLMGFNLYNSCMRGTHGNDGYEVLYSKKIFLPKLLKLILPYVAAMGILFTYLISHGKASYPMKTWVALWLRGGTVQEGILRWFICRH